MVFIYSYPMGSKPLLLLIALEVIQLVELKPYKAGVKMDYRHVVNGIGLQSVLKRIDVPNAELGIKEGEDLRSQNLKIQYQTPKNFVILPQPTAYEHWQVDGHSQPIDQTKLQKDYWFGDPKGAI